MKHSTRIHTVDVGALVHSFELAESLFAFAKVGSDDVQAVGVRQRTSGFPEVFAFVFVYTKNFLD